MVTQVQLTRTGPQFSQIVAGLWRLVEWQMSADDLVNWIETVLELGITTFDHADIYGNYGCEELFGKALAQRPDLRDQMQIVTKCGITLLSDRRPENKVHAYDTSAAHITASVENSLKVLHTDHIDLLLIHRPDALMDADEVAATFSSLRASGKALHFGVSNFTPFQYELLAARLDFPLVTNQIELSVVHMDTIYDGTLDQCQRLRVRPMAWSPFGGGSLFTGQDERSQRLRAKLAETGEALGGASLDQVALAWIMKHPSRPLPILGTGKLDRVRSAVQAEALDISREQWWAIWEASTGNEVP